MKYWLLGFLSCLAVQANAQQNAEPDAPVVPRDHIGISVGATFIRPEVEPGWGKEDLKMLTSPGLQIGFSRYCNFMRGWNLETGFTAGVQLVSYEYRDIELEREFVGASFFEFPLRAGKHIRLSEKVALLPQAGISLRSYSRFESTSSNGGSGTVTNPGSSLGLKIQFSPDYNFAPYLQLGLGSQFMLRRNLFQVRVIYSRNLVPNIQMMSGHYNIREGSTITGSGTVQATGNSVVLETSYIFTRADKKKQAPEQ